MRVAVSIYINNQLIINKFLMNFFHRVVKFGYQVYGVFDFHIILLIDH